MLNMLQIKFARSTQQEIYTISFKFSFLPQRPVSTKDCFTNLDSITHVCHQNIMKEYSCLLMQHAPLISNNNNITNFGEKEIFFRHSGFLI